MQNTQLLIEQLNLNEDELRMLVPALLQVRQLGFGSLELSVKQGYIYNVSATLNYNQADNNQQGNKK